MRKIEKKKERKEGRKEEGNRKRKKERKKENEKQERFLNLRTTYSNAEANEYLPMHFIAKKDPSTITIKTTSH